MIAKICRTKNKKHIRASSMSATINSIILTAALFICLGQSREHCDHSHTILMPSYNYMSPCGVMSFSTLVKTSILSGNDTLIAYVKFNVHDVEQCV